MTSVLLVVIAAVTAGYFAGGRLTRLAQSGVRLTGLAGVGLVFQLAPVDGLGSVLPRTLLLLSFALLVVFGAVNLRRAGFLLFLLGILLNLTVIALNDGMPISADALVASGDRGQIAQLEQGYGGAKYHLAGDEDRLIPLTDVIVLPPPIGEVVSIGDLFVDAGVAWFLFSAMGPGTGRHGASRAVGTGRTSRHPDP